MIKIKHRLNFLKKTIFEKLGLTSISTITLALTDRCNLKCSMCDIWQKTPEDKKDLSLKVIKGLLGSQHLKGLRYINLTGGEPFLREDLLDIYTFIYSQYPDCQFVISSNGVLTDRIVSFISQVESLGSIVLELSLKDKDSFNNLDRTIRKLKKDFPALRLKIKFVITPWNCFEIEDVAQYCKEYNLPLIVKLIENVKSYTNSINYEKNIENGRFNFSHSQIQHILHSLGRINNNSLVNRGVIKNIIKFLKKEPLIKRCLVPLRSLFINSEGSLYRCRMAKALGNVSNQSFDFVLENSGQAAEEFNGCRDFCKQCVSILRFLV